tara:strand:+ start:14771 stop:15715 length:945 start_codon:yes stop_codon:yes gene_type:complete
MPTHVFNLGSGIGLTTGATGGVSGGGGNNIPTSPSIDIMKDASSGDAVTCSTNVISNAPTDAYGENDVIIRFSATNSGLARIRLYDEGGSAYGDFAAHLCNCVPGSGSSVSFVGMDGSTDGEVYSRTGTQTYAVELYQGGSEPETYRGPLIYQGTTIQAQSNIPGTGWNVGDYVDSGGSRYTIHSYEEVYNDDTYYSIERTSPPLTGYSNNTSVTLSHMKVVWSGTTSNGSSYVVPVRTLNGSTVGTSNDTGWLAISTSRDVDFDVRQIIEENEIGGGTHDTDGKLEFWLRGSGYADTKVKEIGVKILTFAEAS